ncbi:MAG TPA: M23 family peptidase [Pseudolabrys sp.]|nr:M23 family peptidase [Pseudolabrys sp.]
MKSPVLVGATLLTLVSWQAASAQDSAKEMLAPKVTISPVDWPAAAAALKDGGDGTPAEQFARLNAVTEKRLPGIGKSSVPVLLPIDIDALKADADKPDAKTSNKYFGPFQPTQYFLPGPAGYSGTYLLEIGGGPFKVSYKKKPIELEFTGAAFTYDLDGPSREEVFTPKDKDLVAQFPGIRRILHEAHVRYAFERFGVPYILSIQCYDRRPSSQFLSCREADPIAESFLKRLQLAGGTPQTVEGPKLDLTRPEAKSDFTYYAPGDMIPGSGYKKLPGTADYHVYAMMRFPIANAPAYVKSQSFNPWGDCYRTGHNGRIGRKDASYSCKVNGLPLTFNESAPTNFNYPWRDNFCEYRDFLVGQCAGGRGHQGQDIRPANCVMNNEGSDRCEPYHHSIAAVRDGLIWRLKGNLAAYLVLNNANEFVRFRYLHMNPDYMDADGLLTGRQVSEGEIIGKVATWGDYESGTSYHLHFNIQVMTKSGWVWVNPYMSLVLAYEKMIKGRGAELKEGDPLPPVPDKPPVILNPSVVAADKPAAANGTPAQIVKPETKPEAKPAPQKPRKKIRRYRRKARTETDE